MKFEKLEALRGFAALYVVLHHFKIGEGTYLQYITMQGQVAVMLFFVLSGFVIMYSCRNKSKYTFKEYFIKRFRRIYPVLLVAMIVAYITASMSMRSWQPLEWTALIGNILNLQDLERHPGFWFSAYYGNTPLWSLSYEWWFYMLFFPIFKFIKELKRKWIALIVSIFGFLTYQLWPNQLSIIMEYFIIWWWGVELACIYLKHKSFPFKEMNFIFISFTCMLILQLFQLYKYDGNLSFGLHPVIEIRHFVSSFALIIAGLIWKKMDYIGYNFTFKPFLYFAPISYGIYVFHFPMIMKYEFVSKELVLIQYGIAILLVCLLAYLVEVVLQKRVNAFTNKYTK